MDRRNFITNFAIAVAGAAVIGKTAKGATKSPNPVKTRTLRFPLYEAPAPQILSIPVFFSTLARYTRKPFHFTAAADDPGRGLIGFYVWHADDPEQNHAKWFAVRLQDFHANPDPFTLVSPAVLAILMHNPASLRTAFKTAQGRQRLSHSRG